METPCSVLSQFGISCDICPTELIGFESKPPRQVKSHCCHFSAFHSLVTLAPNNVLHTYIMFINTHAYIHSCVHIYVHMHVQRYTGTYAHKHGHMKESFKKTKDLAPVFSGSSIGFFSDDYYVCIFKNGFYVPFLSLGLFIFRDPDET